VRAFLDLLPSQIDFVTNQGCGTRREFAQQVGHLLGLGWSIFLPVGLTGGSLLSPPSKQDPQDQARRTGYKQAAPRILFHFIFDIHANLFRIDVANVFS